MACGVVLHFKSRTITLHAHITLGLKCLMEGILLGLVVDDQQSYVTLIAVAHSSMLLKLFSELMTFWTKKFSVFVPGMPWGAPLCEYDCDLTHKY